MFSPAIYRRVQQRILLILGKFLRVPMGTGSLIPHPGVDNFVTGGGTGCAYFRTLCTEEFQMIRCWRGARSRFREKVHVDMRKHREFVVS